MSTKEKNHFPPNLDRLLAYLNGPGRCTGSSTAVRSAWALLGGRLLTRDCGAAGIAERVRAEINKGPLAPYGEAIHLFTNLTERKPMLTLVDVDVVIDLLHRLQSASDEVESLRARLAMRDGVALEEQLARVEYVPESAVRTEAPPSDFYYAQLNVALYHTARCAQALEAAMKLHLLTPEEQAEALDSTLYIATKECALALYDHCPPAGMIAVPPMDDSHNFDEAVVAAHKAAVYALHCLELATGDSKRTPSAAVIEALRDFQMEVAGWGHKCPRCKCSLKPTTGETHSKTGCIVVACFNSKCDGVLFDLHPVKSVAGLYPVARPKCTRCKHSTTVRVEADGTWLYLCEDCGPEPMPESAADGVAP